MPLMVKYKISTGNYLFKVIFEGRMHRRLVWLPAIKEMQYGFSVSMVYII